MKTDTEDTIAAIATPPGRSALGIVRISGRECRTLLPKVFQAYHVEDIPAFRPILGRMLMDKDDFLDEAVLTFFQSPNSYTREDLAEISCHGNPLILEKVLTRIVAAGARLAMPGEFTYRAFLNGRLDLVQAEAVHDLISAESVNQVELALQQMGGRLSGRLRDLRRDLIELVSLLEGNIDFSEEQHYHFIDHAAAVQRADALQERVRELLGSFERGRMIREGFNVALIGRPNVGKSSIFNNLLGEDRAIVTATPGTTRDYLKEKIRLGPYLVNLLDTAGIRESDGEVEQEGIRRSWQVIENADLIVLVLDGSEELRGEDGDLWRQVKDRDVILVGNKSDRPCYVQHRMGNRLPMTVSCITGEGMDDLLESISERMNDRIRFQPEDSVVSSLRHRNRLQAAMEALKRGRAALELGLSEELPVVDFHAALSAVGEITGEVSIDDIYEHIFSNFCIGK